MGYFENEEIEQQEACHEYPCPEDVEEFDIESPSTPRSVELEGLEADQAKEEGNDFQLCVVWTPGNSIPRDQKPQIPDDQQTVQQMEQSGNVGTLLAQIG